jgi:hypothetical protein
MDDRHDTPHGEPEPRVPEELARDLTARFGTGVPVPPALDRRIVAGARATFARRRRRRAAWWIGSAAAAIFIGCVLLPLLGPQAPEEPRAGEVARAEDFDGNGRVDIVDALLLARRVEKKSPLHASWDMNRDGTVDRRDAEAIARAAVRLEEG